MLPALYDDQRAELRRAAVMLVFAGAAILPIATPSSFIASAHAHVASTSLAIPAVPAKLVYPQIVLKRDPFRAGELYMEGISGAHPGAAMQTGQADAIGVVLPPNAGAGGAPAAQYPSANGLVTVRAVITGGQGRALIDVGGVVQVFTVGDHIGDQPIVSIGRDGVRLGDGTLLPLAGEK